MPEASDPTLISKHNVITVSEASSYTEKNMSRRARVIAESERRLCLVMREGAVEGGANDWGEVVTR